MKRINDNQLRMVNDSCPFCFAEMYPLQSLTLEVIYRCGSSGSRITGLYIKQCGKGNK